MPGKELLTCVALAPLSALYGAAVKCRLALFRSGILSRHRAGVPVISIGNITVGGTGKTPLVEWIARTVAESGKRPCVLSRGYGRSNISRRVLVSDGETVLVGPADGGDEPVLLAEKLRGVAAVVSDRDRVAAAQWAVAHLGSEALVLDDGFQHVRLARDLDLVVIDATNPWGCGRLLPWGRLREPPRSLARAGAVVLTRAGESPAEDALIREITRLNPGHPPLRSWMRTKTIHRLGETAEPQIEIEAPPEERLFAFCGIGNSQAFFEHARRELGAPLAGTHAFPDHQVYTGRNVEAIESLARAEHAGALITTAKDAVKLRRLRFTMPCYVLEIEICFEDVERMKEIVRRALSDDSMCRSG